MNIKSKLQNTQNNWLLYFGSITFLITFILFFILEEQDNFVSSRMTLFQVDSVFVFALLATIIAPVLEELSFRSFFTNRKWLIITGSLFLPLFTFSELNSFMSWILLGLIYFFAFWNYKIPTNWKMIILLISTSSLFAFVHYKLSDFQSLTTCNDFINTFSFALIAIWITQNFGIKKSMFFHVCNNTIAVILILYSVQFPDSEVKTFEDSQIKITWNRVPRFDSLDGNLTMDNETKTLKVTNFSASKCYDINSSFLSKNNKDLEAVQLEPFMRYNFNVIMKNKSIDIIETTEITKLFNNFLIKQKLVSLLPKE